uniref:Uncharacterized protein n=1 Tax=Globodera rostochiensis TaxID=31243 RepID=A0A914HR61_GLORO
MANLWILILVAFFGTNSLDKAESVKVKLELKTFDEIFGEGWWDKGEAEDLKTPAPTNFGQNVHHQIDRQNTQIGQIEPNSTDQLGQIEPNSTDQLGQIEPNSTDQLGQIEPNSTDQNPPLRESDHSGQIEPNSTDQLGQIEPNSTDQLGQIEPNSTDQLGQIEPNSTDQNPPLRESDHSDNAQNGDAEDERKHKIVAKELGLSVATIYSWKQKLGQNRANNYAHNKQKEFLMKSYYKIKAKIPKISDEDIAKMLKIGKNTLFRWKSQFKQQQLHPNSVDGHFVEENAAANSGN